MAGIFRISLLNLVSNLLNFLDLHQVYIVNNSSDVEAVGAFIKSLKTPYFVTTTTFHYNHLRAQNTLNDNFILIILPDSFELLPTLVEQQMQSHLITNRSKILVPLIDNVDRVKVEEFFKEMWKNQVLNINLIFNYKKFYGTTALTYNPYADDFYVDVPLKIDRNFFRDKTLNFFHKNLTVGFCEIIPSSYRMLYRGKIIWVGRKYNMLEPLRHFYNATLVVKEYKSIGFEVFVNETYSTIQNGIGLAVKNREVDFSIQLHDIHKSLHFDFANAFELSARRLLVPKAGEYPKYLTLWYCYDKVTGFAILGTMILSIFWLRNNLRFLRIECSYSSAAFKIISALFSQPQNIHVRSTSIRTFLASWDMFSLCIMAVFTSHIVTNLVVPRYFGDIDDPVEGLRTTRWKVYSFSDLVHINKKSNILRHEQPEIYSLISSNLHGVNRTELFRMALNPTGREAFLFSKDLGDWVIHKTRFKRGKTPSYHTTKPLYYFLGSSSIARGSPMLDSLNKFGSYSLEAGLEMQWIAKERLYFMTRDESLIEDKTLNLDHLAVAFILLLTGMGLSTIIFLLEVFYSNYSLF